MFIVVGKHPTSKGREVLSSEIEAKAKPKKMLKTSSQTAAGSKGRLLLVAFLGLGLCVLTVHNSDERNLCKHFLVPGDAPKAPPTKLRKLKSTLGFGLAWAGSEIFTCRR
eukprot:1390811-Amphidinium_carterae.1